MAPGTLTEEVGKSNGSPENLSRVREEGMCLSAEEVTLQVRENDFLVSIGVCSMACSDVWRVWMPSSQDSGRSASWEDLLGI